MLAERAEPDEDGALWRDPLLWFTLALTVFAVAPFLLPGYFWGANDARHHVYFLFEYDRLVQDGIWWPRWSPDFAFGYGYPFFNIYGPFSHFLGELLHHFLGFSFVAAVEAVFVVSIVGSAAAMYAYVRTWAGRQAAVVAALVYVYVPYHLLNLYVRGNLAESMALVWLPLCLLDRAPGHCAPFVRLDGGHGRLLRRTDVDQQSGDCAVYAAVGAVSAGGGMDACSFATDSRSGSRQPWTRLWRWVAAQRPQFSASSWRSG